MRVWRRDYYLIWVDLFFVLKWFKLSYKIPRPLLLPLSPNVWKPESFFLFPEKIFKTLFFYLFQVCFTSQLQYSSLCYRGLCKESVLHLSSTAVSEILCRSTVRECDLWDQLCSEREILWDHCVDEVPASKPDVLVDFSSRVGSGDVGQRAEPR